MFLLSVSIIYDLDLSLKDLLPRIRPQLNDFQIDISLKDDQNMDDQNNTNQDLLPNLFDSWIFFPI